MALFLDLPPEILLIILDLLDFPGLLNAAKLNRFLYAFTLTEYFQRLGLAGDQHYAETCFIEFDKKGTTTFPSSLSADGVQSTNVRALIDGIIVARSSPFLAPPIQHLRIVVPFNQSLPLDKAPEIQRLMVQLDHPSLIDKITIELVDFDQHTAWLTPIGRCLTDLTETMVHRCKTFVLEHQADIQSIKLSPSAWMKPELVSLPSSPWYHRLWATALAEAKEHEPSPRETLKFLDLATDQVTLALYNRPWSLPVPFVDASPSATSTSGFTSLHIHNLDTFTECDKLLAEVSFPNLIKCNLGGIRCSHHVMNDFLRRHPSLQFFTRYTGRLGSGLRGPAVKRQRMLPALTSLSGDAQCVAHLLSISKDEDALPALKAIRIIIDNTVSFRYDPPLPSFLPLFLIANRMKRHPVGTLSLTFMTLERLNEWLNMEEYIDEWLDIDYNLDAWLDIEYNLDGIRGRRIILHRVHSLEFHLHESIPLDAILLDRVFAWIRHMFSHLQSLFLQYESPEDLSSRVLVHAKEVRNLLHLWVDGKSTRM